MASAHATAYRLASRARRRPAVDLSALACRLLDALHQQRHADTPFVTAAGVEAALAAVRERGAPVSQARVHSAFVTLVERGYVVAPDGKGVR